MKILWVKANKLLPLHSGGDLRSYHIARHLASRNELCFLSYYDGARDEQYERLLAQHFPGACTVSTGKSHSLPARVVDYFMKQADPAPYAVSRFRSARVQQKLKTLLETGEFDVAVCDFLDAAINLPPSTIPIALFQHNVEAEIWRRHAETEADPLKRWVYGREFRKMLAYERAAVRRFPLVIAVSDHDKQLMSEWVRDSRITVIPTGVELSQYTMEVSDHKLGPLVVFVGAMDWEPNVDAVEFFCRDIWPTVLEKVPEAKFRIVGRNPVRRVQQYAGASIEVTGRVPVVIDHLREAAVVVVPLRIGGGTRLKIYEAMAAGKAVVSTSVGAEGLDVHNGEDIVLADEAPGFAEAVCRLLDDDEARKRLEQAAARLAASYDWSAVAVRFESALQEVTNRTSAVRDLIGQGTQGQ
jgi:glycosyltransferase involved in cell wall biosynthesis